MERGRTKRYLIVCYAQRFSNVARRDELGDAHLARPVLEDRLEGAGPIELVDVLARLRLTLFLALFLLLGLGLVVEDELLLVEPEELLDGPRADPLAAVLGVDANRVEEDQVRLVGDFAPEESETAVRGAALEVALVGEELGEGCEFSLVGAFYESNVTGAPSASARAH